MPAAEKRAAALENLQLYQKRIMKTYQVTVDGQIYAVTVEEMSHVSPAADVPQPKPVPAPQPVAAPKPAPAPAKAPAAPVSGNGTQIKAPIPGKILTVNVTPGAKVKSGDVMIVLEAMKMENDIMAPVDGTVASLSVQVGTSVNTGDLLVVIA